ncbi:hypothetical protein [Streptomyces caniscabiei]|uniref:hypothetical protein n=1 Tax=Streptomyces caniscabiei TaxID=2746961 RepID=UPI0029AAF827|nr:hypothetical protein [Streptomyces caniscabiei]MDX3733376.1 hypothetical protein [Streptomyces caniscabiei]
MQLTVAVGGVAALFAGVGNLFRDLAARLEAVEEEEPDERGGDEGHDVVVVGGAAGLEEDRDGVVPFEDQQVEAHEDDADTRSPRSCRARSAP